jgi:hypothetical protein
MSREPSYFEHNGMPLHASPNAGRVRQMQEPWLGLFTAHRVHPSEQRPSGTSGIVMPEPSIETIGINEEAEGSAQQSASEFVAAPSLLQRAGTIPSASVTQSTNQQQPQLTSAAQPDKPNVAVSSLMGQQAIPVNIRHAEPAHRTEIKAAGGPDGEGANLSTGSDSLRNDFSDAVPLPPRVLVQKHLTIQTEISSISNTSSEPPTTLLPGGTLVPLMAAMGSPISLAGEAGTQPGRTLTSNGNFSASTVIPAAVPVRFARTPMGAGNIPIIDMSRRAMPEIQPQSDRSQRALLERLNDRASPQQQAGVGRRVHIGNLRITVQRPAMAATQTPSSAPLPQPQAAAAAGQTLFNPWERHYMAFD